MNTPDGAADPPVDVDEILREVDVQGTTDHTIDPDQEIEEVKKKHMTNDNYPGTGHPPIDGMGPRELVCPEDACHWRPCEQCEPTRWKCKYPARHPIHLTSRLMVVYNKIQDESKASGHRWVTKFCKCHPARQN